MLVGKADNPILGQIWFLPFLVALNTLLFFLPLLGETHFSFSQQILTHDALILRYGFVPARFELITLLTSSFLHGDLWHLVGNMYFLWIFGSNVEDVLGAFLFCLAYMICSLCGDLVYFLIYRDSWSPVVGASGAISGVIGMYMVLFPRTKVKLWLWDYDWGMFLPERFEEFQFSVVFGVIAWAAYQVVAGVYGYLAGIAYWSHLGGLGAGMVLGYVFSEMGFLEAHRDRVLRMSP